MYLQFMCNTRRCDPVVLKCFTCACYPRFKNHIHSHQIFHANNSEWKQDIIEFFRRPTYFYYHFDEQFRPFDDCANAFRKIICASENANVKLHRRHLRSLISEAMQIRAQ